MLGLGKPTSVNSRRTYCSMVSQTMKELSNCVVITIASVWYCLPHHYEANLF